MDKMIGNGSRDGICMHYYLNTFCIFNDIVTMQVLTTICYSLELILLEWMFWRSIKKRKEMVEPKPQNNTYSTLSLYQLILVHFLIRMI